MADSKFAAMHEDRFREVVTAVGGTPAVVKYNPMSGVVETIHAGPGNPNGTEVEIAILSPKRGHQVVAAQIITYAGGKVTATAAGIVKDGALKSVGGCSIKGDCGDRRYPSILAERILIPALR